MHRHQGSLILLRIIAVDVFCSYFERRRSYFTKYIVNVPISKNSTNIPTTRNTFQVFSPSSI